VSHNRHLFSHGRSLSETRFQSDFFALGDQFFAALSPKSIEKPTWGCLSSSVCDLLGLDRKSVEKNDLPILSGQRVPEDANPLAMVYSGHQFGSYISQLGDGRGILLGELEGIDGKLYDLHLKGAGQTPFSRMGDGRAVLRSSVREFLCSEAMAALGVPTTRALSLVKGEDSIIRERIEPSAIIARVAQTHIRFGSFEYFYYTGQKDELVQLLDYCILRYFPLLTPCKEGYEEFFLQVLQKSARMVAKWQAIGFCHGVMNTDNMSILGETFDYGPFGFLDSYNPAHICNHSDYSGRYAFNQQPNISYWNCACLGQSLSGVITEAKIKSILSLYPDYFEGFFLSEMRTKLGLKDQEPGDAKLIQALLKVLAESGVDYTNFFRLLSKPDFFQVREIPGLKENPNLKLWLDKYQQRLSSELYCPQLRSVETSEINPAYILRNYLAQKAIVESELNNFEELSIQLELLSNPYKEREGYEVYAEDTPDWGRGMQLSCSS
jgi:uncharacterized protein YdiU (UPF0061 family)